MTKLDELIELRKKLLEAKEEFDSLCAQFYEHSMSNYNGKGYYRKRRLEWLRFFIALLLTLFFSIPSILFYLFVILNILFSNFSLPFLKTTDKEERKLQQKLRKNQELYITLAEKFEKEFSQLNEIEKNEYLQYMTQIEEDLEEPLLLDERSKKELKLSLHEEN